MTGLVGLIALVVCAFLVAGAARSKSGYGFLSGGEFLVVGALIGPQALELIDHDMLDTVRPGLTMAVTFVGVLFGMRVRRSRLKFLGLTGALAVLVEAGGTLALVGFGLPRMLESEPSRLAIWATALVAAPSTKSIFPGRARACRRRAR